MLPGHHRPGVLHQQLPYPGLLSPSPPSDKIQLEAPYHALTNAGHISYVEMDGDPLQNLDAFEKVIRCMKEAGIGYGSVNHPVDRDPVLRLSPASSTTSAPAAAAQEDDGDAGFERIRRITGYLVGTVDRFNNAKTGRGAGPGQALPH